VDGFRWKGWRGGIRGNGYEVRAPRHRVE
jgi:hypothetical protein